jgi:CPA2 family monovalent cation:H+ antiporter-2
MCFGGLVIIGIIVFIYKKKEINLPFAKQFARDHEIQVFSAIALCFGGAVLSLSFGLSAALGAFVGGLVMHAGKETEWLRETLDSFRIIFVSLFFIAVGLQINLNFIVENWDALLIVLSIVFLTNHLLNTLVLRYFSRNWSEAFLGGALLAQIGELSFVVASLAYTHQIIGDYGYNFGICLISIALIISPFWIRLAEKVSGITIQPRPHKP